MLGKYYEYFQLPQIVFCLMKTSIQISYFRPLSKKVTFLEKPAMLLLSEVIWIISMISMS